MSRTRIRNESITINPGGASTVTSSQYNATLKVWTPVGTSAITSSSAQLTGGESIITDMPGKSTVTTKSVEHRIHKWSRVKRDNYDEISYSNGVPVNRYVMSGPNAHWYSWGQYGVIPHSAVSRSYKTTIGQDRTVALSRFNDNNEVDSLLNLIEAPQLVSSLRSLGELVRRVKSGGISGAIRTVNASGSMSAVRSGLKARDLSNLYLMWQFGFAPLLSDMRKLVASVRTLKSRLDTAIAKGGKPFVAAVRSEGELTLNLAAFTGYCKADVAGTNTKWWHDHIQYVHRPLRIVGVKGIHSVPYKTEAFKRLDYFIQRFGSPGPISLLWERIPFSFVVDWIVNLSGIIDSLDDALTGQRKKVLDVWTSERYHLYVSAVKHNTTTWGSDSDGIHTVQNELKYYRRDPLHLDIMPEWSGRFGKKQVALSAALLHQLVANLKR